MRYLYILCVLFLIIFSANAQTPRAVSLADSLIKSGTFKVAITTYEFPSEIKILQDSILARLKRNPEWPDTYLLVMIEKGDFWDLKYMNEYGITREEYNIMIEGFKQKKQPVYSNPVSITIKKINGVISFQASGKASLLNYLTINTKSKIISYEEQYMSREYEAHGKFYAPTLNGIETLGAENGGIIKGYKSKTKTDIGGVTIGFNKKDGKPVIALGILIKETSRSFPRIEFITMTIL